MGENLNGDTQEQIITWTEFFEHVEPWFIAAGMTHEQFWFDDPKIAEVYRKAETVKLEKANNMAWLQGQYMVSALSATVGNMFKKRGARPNEYLSEPLPLSAKEIEKRRIRDMKLAEKRIIEQMERRMRTRAISKKKT